MNNIYYNIPFTMSNNTISFGPYDIDDINYPDVYFKGISCNNGIHKIHVAGYKSNNNLTVSNTYTCADINNEGPLGQLITEDIGGYSLNDIATNGLKVDCKNKPITYFSLNRNKVIYACGENSTDNVESIYEYIYPNNDERSNKNREIILDCADGVLTKFELYKTTTPYIKYTCNKKLTDNTTSTPGNIFLNTKKTNYINSMNVFVNNYSNPTIFWGSNKYSTSKPASRMMKTSDKVYTDQLMSVNCEGSAISGISVNDDNKLNYGCGTALKDLQDYSYEYTADPGLYNYYRSGAILDKVKCPDGSVLSAFSTTVSKKGPKVKWTCGKLQ